MPSAGGINNSQFLEPLLLTILSTTEDNLSKGPSSSAAWEGQPGHEEQCWKCKCKMVFP